MRILPRHRFASKEARIEGALDGFDGRRVHGWAFDPAAPSRRLVVEIVVAGRATAVVADESRPDLAAAGKGDGLHGFSLILDDPIHPASIVVARLAATGQDLAGSPLDTDPVALLSGPAGRPALDILQAEAARATIAAGRVGAAAQSPARQKGYETRARVATLLAPTHPDIDPEGLVTNVVTFVLHRHRMAERLPIGRDLHDRLAILSWYLTDYAPSGPRLRPLSAAQLAFLNQPAPVFGTGRETSIAAYNLMRTEPSRPTSEPPAPGDASAADPFEALVRWIGRAAELAPGGELITPPQVDALTSVPLHEASGLLPLNVFAERLRAADARLRDLNPGRLADRAALVMCLAFRSVAEPHLVRLLPGQAIDALRRPGGPGGSTFDRLLRLAMSSPQSGQEGGRDQAAVSAAVNRRLAETAGPAPAGPSPAAEADVAPCASPDPALQDGLDPGVAVIGPLQVMSGLGQATRLSVAALEAAGLRPAVRNFKWDIPSPEEADATPKAPALLRPRHINLVQVNADTAPFVISHLDRRIYESSYNILYCFWELDRLPAWQGPSVRLFDEIWVASEFGRAIFARETDAPVTHVGMAVDVSAGLPSLDRAQYGLSATDVVFLAVFDSFSYVQRKNPLAVVRAFAEAFPAGSPEPVRLVLKTQNRTRIGDPHQIRARRELEELVADDPRIVVIDATLDYPDLMALKRAANCYVSLHRSEGFGFGMIEAMSLGVPVIATAYSGNMEFCTADNSFLVDYELVPVAPQDYAFCGPGSVWAEPSIASAAAAMRRVLSDPGEAARRAEAAARDAKGKFSPAAIGRRYRERLQAICEATGLRLS